MVDAAADEHDRVFGDDKAIVGGLKEAGWTIGAGYGPLKETTIRIGHMGDHTVGALEELLALLDGLMT